MREGGEREGERMWGNGAYSKQFVSCLNLLLTSEKHLEETLI